jgi:hypothetical protein
MSNFKFSDLYFEKFYLADWRADKNKKDFLKNPKKLDDENQLFSGQGKPVQRNQIMVSKVLAMFLGLSSM